MSVSSGAIRPAEGTMGEMVRKLQNSLIYNVPRLGEELVVFDKETGQAYNLGRVVFCEFDGSSREFSISTHRMRTLDYVLIVSLAEGVASPRVSFA